MPVSSRGVRYLHASSATEDASDDDLVIVGPRVIHASLPFTLRVSALILACLAGFTAAFCWLERWPLLDALYFVCSTAATIGFGDLRPVSRAGRALTCALGCFGVALLGNLVSATLAEWQDSADEKQPAKSRWPPRMRLGLWQKAAAQFAGLLLVGVLGVRFFESPAARPTWASAVYLISGVLTTAGLGDVVPLSRGAKNFVSVYSVLGTLAFARVVGRIALQPLEAEHRAAQLAVVQSYASPLTEDLLAELSHGPIVKKLGLSQSDEFCSRNEFVLLLLVQQGKVQLTDVEEAKAAFDRLDVDQNEQLDWRDIELLQKRYADAAADVDLTRS